MWYQFQLIYFVLFELYKPRFILSIEVVEHYQEQSSCLLYSLPGVISNKSCRCRMLFRLSPKSALMLQLNYTGVNYFHSNID